MALDKNYIDVSEDSIASVAVNFYSRKGPLKYRARAYYYLGLAYYYQQDYDKAILELTKAEKAAEVSDSLYWGITKSFHATGSRFKYIRFVETRYTRHSFCSS